MNVIIQPGKLCGRIKVPSSKSMAHRLLICGALAEGETRIDSVSFSQDINATIEALGCMGAGFRIENSSVYVTPLPKQKQIEKVIDCNESGSTLRFLTMLSLLFGGARFTGKGKLMQRPMEPYFSLFREKGIAYSLDKEILSVNGTLNPGTYYMDGGVSSQFISGLLFALSRLEERSTIEIKGVLCSRGYIDMTLAALRCFGTEIANEDYRRFIVTPHPLMPQHIAVEGDYSQAAFFLGANFLGSHVQLENLAEDSLQGDKAIVPLLEKMKCPGLLEIDVDEIPDLVPILAGCASLRVGSKTVLYNAARLRLKESDRIDSTVSELAKLGADIYAQANSIHICGKEKLIPEIAGECVICDSWNDHRIAMMVAIAATRCSKTVILQGAEAVEKSYPLFWKAYRQLKGEISFE